MENYKLPYREEIDGLRAIAILFVLLYHIYPHYFPNGFIGVDIFFVISGYLISGIILNTLYQNNSFCFIDFYEKRIKRIFPSLIFLLITLTAFGWYFLLPEEYIRFGKHLSASMGFYENFLLIHESTDYFNEAVEYKPLMHLWSLSIEEQFYIFYPLIIVMAWKFNIRIHFLLVTLILLSLFYFIFFNINYSSSQYFMTISRAWELLFGGLLAFINVSYKNQYHRIKTRSIFSFIGTFLMLFIPFVELNIIVSIILSVAGTSLIIYFSRDTVVAKVLSLKLIVYVGLISYPLYLWHWAIISFYKIIYTKEIVFEHSLYIIIISFSMAIFSYETIEKKIKKYKVKNTFLILLGLIIFYFGFYINITEGFSYRFTNKFNPEEVIKINIADYRLLCEETYPQFKSNCAGLSKNKKPTILILGDSHAEDLLEGIAVNTTQSVLALSAGGCRPYLNGPEPYSDPRICQDLTRRALDFMIKDKNISTIIMTNYKGKDATISGYTEAKDFTPELELSIRNTFQYLIDNDKNIIFIFDRPKLKYHIKECLDIRGIKSSKDLGNCNQFRIDIKKNNHYYKEFYLNILKDFPKVEIIDSEDIFCDDSICFAEYDGMPLYRDTNHLSGYGSQFVGQYIQRKGLLD